MIVFQISHPLLLSKGQFQVTTNASGILNLLLLELNLEVLISFCLFIEPLETSIQCGYCPGPAHETAVTGLSLAVFKITPSLTH